MGMARSRDGTRIAYDQRGSGPPVLLVDGAFDHRAWGTSQQLAELLASHFKVIAYDRRGKGDSGNARLYSIDREVEDIAALIAVAGGTANLYGASTGAALALEAARRGLNIRKLALYEPPFVVDATRPAVAPDLIARLQALIKVNRRSAAVRLFLTTAGVPAMGITLLRLTPTWAKLKQSAHTLVHEAAIMAGDQEGKALSAARWSSITLPVLVMEGARSPRWMHNAMLALQHVLANARYQQLPGEKHRPRPEAMAPALREFFGRLTPEELPFLRQRYAAGGTAPWTR